ncbi:MAG TPA: hypothetical protein VM694_30455 [Polyangium sp.]|nr:hypothetical protein [Polyangium sp.]
MRFPSGTLALLFFALVACGKSDSKQTPENGKTTPDAKPSAAAATTQAAPAETTAPVAPPATALPPRPGRSSMPTLAEWSSQQKEVTVKGSSALGCETKIVREYLRVSCHGKNDTGGTPTNVVVKKGGRGEALTYASPGVASLIIPFVDGIDFAADFSWTDKSHTLTVKWPKGSEKPAIVGVFEGSKSPLDRPTGDTSLADKLCACHKKVTKEATCDGLLGAPDLDCNVTFGNDCEMLLACARSEPSAMPICRAGYRRAFLGHCYKRCDTGPSACAPNETCEELSDNEKVCVAN